MMGLLQTELETKLELGKHIRLFPRFVLLGGIPIIQIMLHKSS